MKPEPPPIDLEPQQESGSPFLDWFERIVGFKEATYERTRDRLRLVDGRLVSEADGRSFAVGRLETPSLGELREAVDDEPTPAGRLTVRNVTGDAGALHADLDNAGALFQVASQFNLLEMVGPSVTPEDGVTGYAHDHTQGPACAIAAGAATIYRNYLVPLGHRNGQTRDHQIDCLADVGDALGNADGSLWDMRNGYALCTEEGLARINARLASATDDDRDALRDLLRIGLHWDVQVTGAARTPLPDGEHLVSQAFCSALPVAYSASQQSDWEPFARLVLEGAYEATLLAGIINARATGCRRVLLTQLGGGAFGNGTPWIHDAMRRAFESLRDVALDVAIVSHTDVHAGLVRLADAFPR